MKKLRLNTKKWLFGLLSACFAVCISTATIISTKVASADTIPEKIESLEIEGAAVRIDVEFGGMRFGSKVKKSDVVVPTGYSVKFGTLIIPKSLLTQELTIDNKTDDIMNLVIDNPVVVTEDEVEYYSLRGVVSNIPKEYYKSEVMGRGYISVINETTGEVVKTYYTEALARNIAYVAYKAQIVDSQLTDDLQHYYDGTTFYEVSVDDEVTCDYDYAYAGQVLNINADFENIESVTINSGAVEFNSENKTFVMPNENINIAVNYAALALKEFNGADVSFLPNEAREYLSKASEAEVAEYLMNYHLNEWDKDNIPDSAQPLTLSWKGGTSGEFIVTIATDSAFTNVVSVQTYTERSADIYNLVPATYYWKVADSEGNVSATDSFTVTDTVRTIYLDNIKNVRDIGGYTGEFGTLSYGKLYRSKDIANASEEAIDILVNQLGVKTEIDLRMDDNSGAAPDSRIEYINTGFWQFDYLFPGLNDNRPYNIVYTDALYSALQVLANSNKYPIIFHCTAGADRTGTFAFLINGLCGVSYEDLVRDFELTSFYSGRRWRSAIINNEGVYSFAESGVMLDDLNDNLVSFGKMYNHIMEEYATSEGTLSSAIANYLYKVVNLSIEDMHAIRGLLIDGYDADDCSLDFLLNNEKSVDVGKDLATQINAWKNCGGEITIESSITKGETKSNVLTFSSANKGENVNNNRYGDYYHMYNISISKLVIEKAIADGYSKLSFKYATKDETTVGAVSHRFFVYDYIGKGSVNGSDGFIYRDVKETASTQWNAYTIELESLLNGSVAFASAGDTLYLAEVFFEKDGVDLTQDLATQANAWTSYDGMITVGESYTTKDGVTNTALKFYTATNTGVNANNGNTGEYYRLSNVSIKAEIIAQAISEGYTTITFTFAAPNTPSGGVSNRVSWHNYKGTGTVNGAQANTASATGYIARKTAADSAWNTVTINLSDLTNGTLAIAAAGDTLYLTNVTFGGKGIDFTKDLATQADAWTSYDGEITTGESYTTKDGVTNTALKFYTATNTGVNSNTGHTGEYYYLSNISIKAEVIAQAISKGYTTITFTFAAPNTPSGGVSNRVSWHNYKGTGTVNGAQANTASATGYIARKTAADSAWNTVTINLSDLTNGTLAIAAAGDTLYLTNVTFGGLA